MPAILLYLLKVNIALLLFCLFYYTILRRLTFYNLNRVYLIVAILFSTIYPLIDFTRILQRNERLVAPIQVVVVEFNIKAANFAKPVAQTNYWQWLVFIFWAGVAIMALRLAMQFISLWKIYRRSEPASINNHYVRVIHDEANPFSFWQSIYINPKHHAAEELQSIIAHEQVHVSQWHTLDILLAEISLVFYWFNPGVWLMKKAVAENLEFITDHKILQQGIDAKSYQYSLLYASFNTSPNAMVNHFNISTIKKRIMMMNSKRSSAYSLSRYGLIAPAVLALVLVFGTTKAELLKKGADAAKSATQKALTIAGTSLNTAGKKLAINPIASTVNSIQKSAESIAGLISSKDTSIRLTNIQFTADTPKIKAATKIHFTGPDTGYYVLDGKKVTPKELLDINADDIVSFNMIGAQSSSKIFGEEAKNGSVLVVTKAGENTTAVKNLLQKINAIKATGKFKDTGILDIKPAKGTLNSITINSTTDSTYRKTPGYSSSSYTVTGGNVINATGKVLHPGTTIVASSANYSENSTSPKTDITATDIVRGLGIKHDITVKNIFDEAASITVRGAANANPPLFIIDGKAAAVSVFNSLKPDAIESVSVLKDASATAVYGDSGKNGVIVVTTKEGAKALKPLNKKN